MSNFEVNKEWQGKMDVMLGHIGDLLVAKHLDYGEDNLKRRGQLGIIIRIEDKLSRIENLLKGNPNMVGESITKEWQDIAGYAVQAMVLFSDEHTESELGAISIIDGR